MTKPTQAQIKAAKKEYLNRCGHYQPPSEETFAAILTAAAEVGDNEVSYTEDDVKIIIAANIERCALVVDALIKKANRGEIAKLEEAAAEIRKLGNKSTERCPTCGGYCGQCGTKGTP